MHKAPSAGRVIDDGKMMREVACRMHEAPSAGRIIDDGKMMRS
jgi:hypothetical protein